MGGLIQRRYLLASFIFAMAASLVLAAPKTYKYRCPKCNLIQEFSQPGAKKCPNDGRAMIPMH